MHPLTFTFLMEQDEPAHVVYIGKGEGAVAEGLGGGDPTGNVPHSGEEGKFAVDT